MLLNPVSAHCDQELIFHLPFPALIRYLFSRRGSVNLNNHEFNRANKEGWRYFMRLYNKKSGSFNDNKVHEKIELNGSTRKLCNNIYHYSYHSLNQYFDKFNRYSTYGAEMAFQRGKRKSLFAVVTAIPFNFLKYYFIELNFLNGLSGFYWSVLNAFYHFAKYIKIRELHQQQREVQKNEIKFNSRFIGSVEKISSAEKSCMPDLK